MIIIGPFYTKKSYTRETVSIYIGKNYSDFKYYGYYERKNFTPLRIYRFYTVLPDGQKKLYPLYPLFFFFVKESRFVIFLICSSFGAGTNSL